MELTITKIYRSDKDKNGNPLKNKNGNPYERVSIKAVQTGDKWISGFGNEGNKKWTEGMTINIEVEEKNGFLNFKNPSKLSNLFKMYKDLEERVAKLEARDNPYDKDNNDPNFEEEEQNNIDDEQEEIPF